MKAYVEVHQLSPEVIVEKRSRGKDLMEKKAQLNVTAMKFLLRLGPNKAPLGLKKRECRLMARGLRVSKEKARKEEGPCKRHGSGNPGTERLLW